MTTTVEYQVVSQARWGHFGVPRWVLRELGLQENDDITLDVLGADFRWQGTTSMRSGEEIYFRQSDPTTHGLEKLRPKTAISVKASRPVNTAR